MYNREEALRYIKGEREFLDTVVKENTEKYRKGNARVLVVDENGVPQKNKTVKIRQVSHEFKFGANLFLLNELETDEKNKKYKSAFSELFNMATLPFYWDSVEPEKGKMRYEIGSEMYYRRPPIDLCMDFCRENGIEPREHALAYENHFPVWLKDSEVDEIKRELTRRYEEISTRYADKINTIEVTNEMFWYHSKTKFYDAPDYLEWCFKQADKYFPKNQLVVNESTEEAWCQVRRPNSQYYSYVENLMLKGARVDAIGMQFHMFYERERELERASSLYRPTNLYKYLDFYSRLINHLQITEITIPAYSNEKRDEEIQAEIIEALYRVWFSHPACEQIIYWNLVDGYTYVDDPTPENIARTQGDMTVGENRFYGGLLRFDMTPKPAYLRLKELITKEWRTNLETQTDENGHITFRGFYGEYEIEADGAITKFKLAKSE